ncbi:TIGR02611 family protein [Gephyromycinifex aptenodytis]|uniref:TIGR02611 family protein n=1 Tax=Gephyromycinifex aptenodytis TaxID=2716227 RepID=UPI001446F286|nr:TIGR02611 family protein [Gephyromycinifex aptenodytis]
MDVTRDEASAAPSPAARATAEEHHLLRGRDWAWRRRIRANPRSRQIYRWVVGGLGFVIVVAGLLMVPFPGPGWLVVFIGVSIWASEFHWARRLHLYGMGKLRTWNDWVMAQGLLVRGGLFLLTCLFVNAVLWTMLKLMGIPDWVPQDVASFAHAHLAL